MWRIKNWNDTYESSRSREVENLTAVLVPVKQDGDGYLTLLDHKNGPAHYGAFVAIVLLAGKCKFNGQRTGLLIQSNGLPHTAETIARKTHLPASLIADTLQRCSDATIGWVEWVEDGAGSSDLFGTQPAGPARAAVVGTSSADDCRSDGRAAAGGLKRSGIGIGIPSSSPPPTRLREKRETEAEKEPEPGEADPGQADPVVLEFQCSPPGVVWGLTRSHLQDLVEQWGDRVAVEPCLRDLAKRQVRETKLRKAAIEMPSYVQSWIGQDFRTFHKYPAEAAATPPGPRAPSSRGNVPAVLIKPAGVKDRALAMLEAS